MDAPEPIAVADYEQTEEYRELMKSVAEDAQAVPIRWAKPRDYTIPFLLDKRPYVFAGGGKRSSKSWTNVLLACVGLTGEDMILAPGALDLFRGIRESNRLNGLPPFRVRHWCTDLEKVGKKILLPIYRRFIPSAMIADTREKVPGYNDTDHTFHLKDGSYVEFFSYKMDKVDRESAELDLIPFDEPPSYELFESQKARLATTGGFIRGAMTLDERATSSYDIRWIDRMFRRGKGGPDYGWHHFDTERNVNAVADEKGGEQGRIIRERMVTWKRDASPEERAISIEGLGGWCTGLVYGMFSEEVHASYDKLTPDELVTLARGGYGELWGSLDFGTDHPTAASVFYRATVPLPEYDIAENDLIKVAEYKRRHPHFRLHIAAIKAMNDRFGPVQAIFACPWIFSDTDVRRTPGVAVDFIEAGLPLRRANNRDEMDGIEAFIDLLYPKPGMAWPRYRICKNACPATVDEFQTFSWKAASERSPRGTDLVQDCNNDILDGDRYLVKHLGLYARSAEVMAQQAWQQGPALDPTTGFPVDEIFNGVNMFAGL
jgi:hypothetical protein